jgi:TrmH family RNA methyltransferase
MGAFMHVNVCYTPLEPLLERARSAGIPVYGTVLGGASIYNSKLSPQGIILLGNESKGLTDRMLAFVTDFITIPGPDKPLAGIESLNVSMAAAIICSEFARRKKV